MVAEPGAQEPEDADGELSAFYEPQVGDYRLGTPEIDDYYLGEGATEAYTATYEKAGGQRIVHDLADFGTATEAERFLDRFADVAVTRGYTVDQRFDVGTEEVFGRGVVLVDEGSEWVMWHNRGFFFVALGSGGQAVAFYNELPY